MARRPARRNESPEGEQEPPIVVVTPDGLEAEPDDDRLQDDLAFLSADMQGERSWMVFRFKSPAELANNPRGKSQVLVTKLTGPIDIVQVQRELGGGVFRFVEQLPGGVFGKSRVIEFDGPRRDNTVPPPPAAPRLETGNGHADDRTMRYLKFLTREIRELKAHANAPVTAPAPQPAGNPIETIAAVFNIADKIAQRSQPSEHPIETMMGLFQKGVEMGTQREPQPAAAGTDWASLIREGLPMVRDILVAGARARAGIRPGGAPPAPAVPAGTATATSSGLPVSPEPATPPPPPTEDPAAGLERARWTAAVNAIGLGLARGSHPGDVAAALETMLEDNDLAGLRLAGLEQVQAQIATFAPVFSWISTPQGQAYIARVHAELVNPSESDEDDEIVE